MKTTQKRDEHGEWGDVESRGYDVEVLGKLKPIEDGERGDIESRVFEVLGEPRFRKTR